MKIKDGYILRNIAGDNIVLSSGDQMDLNVMLTLNDTGRFLWECLTNDTEEDELVIALLDEYDVDEFTARTDVSAFIEKLNANNLLT